jgi:hypothetical protein
LPGRALRRGHWESDQRAGRGSGSDLSGEAESGL